MKRLVPLLAVCALVLTGAVASGCGGPVLGRATTLQKSSPINISLPPLTTPATRPAPAVEPAASNTKVYQEPVEETVEPEPAQPVSTQPVAEPVVVPDPATTTPANTEPCTLPS
ncbi:MAG TPA: hypothetical protein VIK02_01945 [Candidatus Anoxymicrobiaceae bacterium]